MGLNKIGVAMLDVYCTNPSALLAFAKRVPSVCPTLHRLSFLVPESMTAQFSEVASQRYYCSSHAGGEMLFDSVDMNAA